MTCGDSGSESVKHIEIRPRPLTKRTACLTWVPLLALLILPSVPVLAQEEEDTGGPPVNRWTIIPEGKVLVEYNSNAIQQPGFRDDTIAKLFAGAIASYNWPTDTSVLMQCQAQIWRYADLPIFNVALNILTLIASQKFDLVNAKIMDTISIFGGGQMVYKQPTTQGFSRLDFNALAGFSATKAFGSDKLLVGGYQFANLLADVPQTAYSAHGMNILFRWGLLREVIFNASYQLQLRLPQDPSIPKNLRNTLGVGFEFLPIPGLSITLNGDYSHEYAAPIRFRHDYFSVSIGVGSNLAFGLP